jgi:hypothetical protein
MDPAKRATTQQDKQDIFIWVHTENTEVTEEILFTTKGTRLFASEFEWAVYIRITYDFIFLYPPSFSMTPPANLNPRDWRRQKPTSP